MSGIAPANKPVARRFVAAIRYRYLARLKNQELYDCMQTGWFMLDYR